jgi:TolA-binding protein
MLAPSAPHAPPPKPAAPAPTARDAKAALADGQPERALEILDALSRGAGPAAENAAYEMGLVLRDHLLKPRQAIAAWKRYRNRAPRGLLRAEADLQIIETQLAVGDRDQAQSEVEAFLDRHPDSERRHEMSRLLQRLRGSR